MSFKTDHREFQELVRELLWLRDHNQTFGPADPQDTLLQLSEAAMTLVALERFLRMVLGSKATDKETLPNLLEKATSKSSRLLVLPAKDRKALIKGLTDVRNTTLHGNYEQAARQNGCTTVREYFETKFISEVERVYKITDDLVKQIDPETGKRR
jgi:hypothetical protein